MANNGKVCVAVRVRPLIERERVEAPKSHWSVGADNVITQIDPETGKEIPNRLRYIFDSVFDTPTPTEEVYHQIVSPLVQESLNGFNGTLLCYGQTSSGKTYTLYGNDKEEGIISLAAQDLFKHISEDQSRTYIIRVGLMEIYNEKLTDLLNPGVPIEIKELNGVIYPKNLEEIEVVKPEDLLEAAKSVQQKRKVGETQMNKESSRSHTILRIFIESAPRRDLSSNCDGEIQVTNALLNFVDLAGSEKAGQTGATGERLKEAASINRSLHQLSLVVMQLGEECGGGGGSNGNLTMDANSLNNTLLASTTKPKHISYRDSKLTRLLQSSLSGNAYIVLICNITPAIQSIEETHSTLRFAKTAKNVKTEPRANHVLSASAKYQQKIKELQVQLESVEHALGGKSSEVAELKRQLATYMNFFPNPKRSMSNSETINLPITDSKRRKTWCPGNLKAIQEERAKALANANAIEKVINPAQLKLFTPPSSSKIKHEARPSEMDSPSNPDLYLSADDFMSITDPLKHFVELEDQRSIDSSDCEGLLTRDEILKIVKDNGKSSSSAGFARTPFKKPRLELATDTPESSSTRIRQILASALENDKLEWQDQKAFLENDLAAKTQRILELEALLLEAQSELSSIRNFGEEMKSSLEDVETETTKLCKSTSTHDLKCLMVQQVDEEVDTEDLRLFCSTKCGPDTSFVVFNDVGTDAEPILEISTTDNWTEMGIQYTDQGSDADQMSTNQKETSTYGLLKFSDNGTDPEPILEISTTDNYTEMGIMYTSMGTDAVQMSTNQKETSTSGLLKFSDNGTDPEPILEISTTENWTEMGIQYTDQGSDAVQTSSAQKETCTSGLLKFSDNGTDPEPILEISTTDNWTDMGIKYISLGTDAFETSTAQKEVDTEDLRLFCSTKCGPDTSFVELNDIGTDPVPTLEILVATVDNWTEMGIQYTNQGTDSVQISTTENSTEMGIEYTSMGTDAAQIQISTAQKETCTSGLLKFSDNGTDPEPILEKSTTENWTEMEIHYTNQGTDTVQISTAQKETCTSGLLNFSDNGTDPDPTPEISVNTTDNWTEMGIQYTNQGTDTLQINAVQKETSTYGLLKFSDNGTDPEPLMEISTTDNCTEMGIQYTDQGSDAVQMSTNQKETSTSGLLKFSDNGTDPEPILEISTTENWTEMGIQYTDQGTDTLQINTVQKETCTSGLLKFSDNGTDPEPILEISTTDNWTEMGIKYISMGTDAVQMSTNQKETSTSGLLKFSEIGTDPRPILEIPTSTADNWTEMGIHYTNQGTDTVQINAVQKDSWTETEFQARVNRWSQTPEETDLKFCIRNLQIMLKVKERELSDLKGGSKVKDENLRKEQVVLESKLSEMVLEIDGLKDQITILTSRIEVKRKCDQEIQCNYIIEQAKRAAKGESGLLPQEFPDIGKIVRDSKLLRDTNILLDIENRKLKEVNKGEELEGFANPFQRGDTLKRKLPLPRDTLLKVRARSNDLPETPLPTLLPNYKSKNPQRMLGPRILSTRSAYLTAAAGGDEESTTPLATPDTSSSMAASESSRILNSVTSTSAVPQITPLLSLITKPVPSSSASSGSSSGLGQAVSTFGARNLPPIRTNPGLAIPNVGMTTNKPEPIVSPPDPNRILTRAAARAAAFQEKPQVPPRPPQTHHMEEEPATDADDAWADELEKMIQRSKSRKK